MILIHTKARMRAQVDHFGVIGQTLVPEAWAWGRSYAEDVTLLLDEMEHLLDRVVEGAQRLADERNAHKKTMDDFRDVCNQRDEMAKQTVYWLTELKHVREKAAQKAGHLRVPVEVNVTVHCDGETRMFGDKVERSLRRLGDDLRRRLQAGFDEVQ